MVVLSRQAGQTIVIGDDIFVTVEQILSDTATLQICAPAHVIAQIDKKTSNMVTVRLKRDEFVRAGDSFELKIVDIREDKVRVGLSAPEHFAIHRKEVYEAIQRENRRLGEG